LTTHPDFRQAVPTPDHFIPLLYLAGLAAEAGGVRALMRGHALGSISMSCYGLGAEVSLPGNPTGAAELPRDVPPDQTNV
jgi:4,5-DOPA dioxygenase extradiol